jgi:hypothetical protein
MQNDSVPAEYRDNIRQVLRLLTEQARFAVRPRAQNGLSVDFIFIDTVKPNYATYCNMDHFVRKCCCSGLQETSSGRRMFVWLW